MSKHLPRNSATRIILIVTAVVVTYFLVTGGVNAVRSHQLRQQQGQLRGEITALEQRHERLEALKTYLDSDEYIEAVAREQLGLVKEGETGFVAISSQPAPTPGPGHPKPELWWEVLIR